MNLHVSYYSETRGKPRRKGTRIQEEKEESEEEQKEKDRRKERRRRTENGHTGQRNEYPISAYSPNVLPIYPSVPQTHLDHFVIAEESLLGHYNVLL